MDRLMHTHHIDFTKYLSVIVLAVFLSSCAIRPPSDVDNICSIFYEKRLWFRAANNSATTYEIPITLMMAIIHQESRFRAYARPVRNKILWILPGARPSDAYGYAQAIQDTWDLYKKSTGQSLVSRSNFSDAVNFIGWYNRRSVKLLGIEPTDTYNLYLAYHEGWNGYKNKTYETKEWLPPVAEKVQRRAEIYRTQLDGCEKRLRSSWYARILLFPFRLLLLPLRTVF